MSEIAFKTRVGQAPKDKPLLLKASKFCSLGYIAGVFRDDGMFHIETGHTLDPKDVEGYFLISDEYADDF